MEEKSIYKKAKSLADLLHLLAAENIRGAQRYSQIRKYIGIKARESRTPVSGSFELTPLCNLDCKMCYVHLTKSQMKNREVLSVEQWKNIMSQAIDAGMMYAQLTGGECLMYPGFKELYLYLQSRGIEITVKTNGRLLDADMVDFFRQNPPALISVSIYGADDDSYEAVTGHRCFDRVFQNILAVKHHGLPLEISVVPNAFSYDGIKLLHTLHDHGLKWSVNGGLLPPREETGRTIKDASLSTYAEILKQSRLLNGQPLYTICEEQALPEFGVDNQTDARIRCAAGKSCFAIDWKGQLNPCVNFTKGAVSLLSSDFEDAWIQIGKFINEYLAPAECSSCAYNGICFQCVAAHTNAPIGHADHLICERTRFLVQQGIYSLSKN